MVLYYWDRNLESSFITLLSSFYPPRIYELNLFVSVFFSATVFSSFTSFQNYIVSRLSGENYLLQSIKRVWRSSCLIVELSVARENDIVRFGPLSDDHRFIPIINSLSLPLPLNFYLFLLHSTFPFFFIQSFFLPLQVKKTFFPLNFSFRFVN